MSITEIILISLSSIEVIYCLVSSIIYFKQKKDSKKKLISLVKKYEKLQQQIKALEDLK